MKVAREDVVRCFPWTEEIQDTKLPEQVVATWLEVAKDAPYDSLEDCAFGPQIQDLTLVEHVRAVARATLAMAEVLEQEHGLKSNRDMLIANALLHDVSKTVEYYRDQNGLVGYTKVGTMLQHAFIGGAVAYKNGLPLDLVHVIQGHSPLSPTEMKTLEGVIMSLADLAVVDSLYFAKGLPSPRLQKKH